MFNWLFRKPKLVPVFTKPPLEQNHFLHGYDLREWDYLGYSEIFYTYDNNPNARFAANVFFFHSKADENVRQFIIKHHHSNSNFDFYGHTWVNTIAAPWRAGENKWYDPIRTSPSKYTKDRVLLDHDCVWDDKANWWIRATEAERHSAAVTKQKKKKPLNKTEENVVKVDFNAKNNEDA